MSSQRLQSAPDAEPLSRQHMPTDYAISLASYTRRGTPAERRIPDDLGPAQPMRGFEATYRNIIDYIVRITYRIWEDRDVEYIGDTYSAESRVFDDYGLQSGSRKIIADTYHTTGAFPDIQLVADEIVWAGDDAVGFHTSHRTLIRGTNGGASRYGPATGRYVDVLVIANCVALENRIFLEHVLYNTSSLLQQLGLDLSQQVAQLRAAPPAGWPRDASTWQALRCAARPSRPICVATPVAGFDVDRFARETLGGLWNGRDYAVLARAYASDVEFRGPTDRAGTGTAAYRRAHEPILEAIPDLELGVDEVYWMGNEREGFLSSVRWSAEGTHRGPGLYGEPTGRGVQLWGITQHRIVGGRIVAEWTLFNELDLLMQIAAA